VVIAGALPVASRSILASHHLAEPVPLGVGEVTHQAGQREVGRLDRTAGHGIGIEACALELQGEPVVMQVPGEHGALVTVMDENAADPPRVGIRADQHVLPAELPLSFVARPLCCGCHLEHHG
jgi:hypothetical protein